MTRRERIGAVRMGDGIYGGRSGKGVRDGAAAWGEFWEDLGRVWGIKWCKGA